MKILTDKSLDEAIELCKKNERYRVTIVTQYAGDHAPILDYLSQAGANVVRRFNNPFARFLNGGSIDLISSATNTIGRRANLVLCQAEVYNNCEDTKYVLAAMETTNINFKLFKN